MIDSTDFHTTYPGLPSGLFLHVGCGHITPDGWVNLDASWNLLAAQAPGLRAVLKATRLISASAAEFQWSGKIQYCNVNNGLPFGENTAAVVYASHVLEHLTRQHARQFVREAYRVLKPNGVIRLVVPDLEQLARLYLTHKQIGGTENGTTAADDFMTRLHTCREAADSMPLKIYRAYLDTLSHKWMYDDASLQQLLADAGFRELAPRGYLDSRIPNIAEVERANRLELGICVEGIK